MFIKHWIIICISRDLIGLVTIVYEPLYQAQEIATIKLCSGCSCKAKSARSSNISRLLLFHSRLLDMR